jgi:hypothetical protein
VPEIFVQLWEESEAGWGVRPDGASLHLNESDSLIYVKEYWDKMPDTVPAEYSRPCTGRLSWQGVEGAGSLSTGLLEVSEAAYERLKERIGDGKGTRFWKAREARGFLNDG